MWERRGVCRVLVGNPEGKRPLRRRKYMWEDNIQICWNVPPSLWGLLTRSFEGSCSLHFQGQAKNNYSYEENPVYITKFWTLEWARILWTGILNGLLHLENGGNSILRNVEKYNPNAPQKTFIFSSTAVRTSNLA
jgi:hypothetical protein